MIRCLHPVSDQNNDNDNHQPLWIMDSFNDSGVRFVKSGAVKIVTRLMTGMIVIPGSITAIS